MSHLQPTTRPSEVTADAVSMLDNTLRVEELSLSEAGRQMPSDTRPVGDVLNRRYRIEEVIGAGGMGVVYRVTDLLNPDRSLALKTILAQAIKPEQLSLFKAEFKVMAKLRHPNLAAVYDFEPIAGGDEHLFTLDYAPGKNIFDATRGWPWQDTLELVVQVARALAYVHSRQVIHFDIKPANVVVSAERRVKVLDFGLAGARPNRQGGWLMGTPTYMAPEVISGGEGNTLDHRLDLYALGVMLYQLLCRRVPFAATTMVELLQMHRHEPLVFSDADVAHIPPWLRQVVERLCAKQPADRFPSANAFISALNREGGLSHDIETDETRQSYILSSRFVGREHELEKLNRFLTLRTDRRALPSPPAMFIAGQSGMGKSRLMREVRHQAQLSRIAFIEGNSYETSGSEYEAISEVLRYVIRIAEAVGGQGLIEQFGPELCKISPELQNHGFVPSPSLRNDERDRLRLIDQVSEFFLQVADLAPLALYFNDLQWATVGTRDIIAYMLRTIAIRERKLGRRVPLAIFGTFRSDEAAGRPMEKLVGDGALVDTISLKALAADDVRALLTSMLGIKTLPDLFVTRVTQETLGNAFFVEEVMRALLERGSVYLADGEWAAREEIGALDIPSSIGATFRRRAALLSEGECALFDALVVSGRPVSLELLERSAPLGSEELHVALRVLEQKQLVARVASDDLIYRVFHDRMRESRYADIAPDQKRRLHHALAEAIEAVHGDNLEPHLYELGRHWFAAEVKDKARAYSLRGGNHARERFANHIAIELFEQFMYLTEGDETATAVRREVRESLGDVYCLVGNYDRAEQAFSALANAQAPIDRARLERKRAWILFSRGDCVAALSHMWAAAELLGERRPGRGKTAIPRALLKALAPYVLHRQLPRTIGRINDEAERVRRLELAEIYWQMSDLYYFVEPTGMLFANLRAVNLAEPLGDSTQLCASYAMLGFIFSGVLGLQGPALSASARALAIADRVGSPWHKAFAEAQAGMMHLFLGNLVEAQTLLERSTQGLLAYGDMERLGWAWANLVRVLYFRGRLEEARTQALAALDLMERTGTESSAKHFFASQAFLSAETDHTAVNVAERMLEGISRSRKQGDVSCVCNSQTFYGLAQLTAGNYDQAICELENARRTRDENNLMFDYVEFAEPLELRARVLKLWQTPSQRAERKQALAELKNKLATALRRTKNRPAYRPRAWLGRAGYLWLAGKKDEALFGFAAAASEAERLGTELVLGDCHHDWGRALLESGATAEGVGHLETALAIYERCGAEPYARRVKEALKVAS